MEDRNKWILIGLQLFHVILFLVIAIIFLVDALQHMNPCYFPCVGPDAQGNPCRPGDSE